MVRPRKPVIDPGTPLLDWIPWERPPSPEDRYADYRAYSPAEIEQLQAEADELSWQWMCGEIEETPWTAPYKAPATRLYVIIELLRLGCTVRDHPSGLLVNGHYIVAVRKRRWRSTASGRWYWFRDYKDLVERYIRPDMQRCRRHSRVWHTPAG
jgi:hypothetical protein